MNNSEIRIDILPGPGSCEKVNPSRTITFPELSEELLRLGNQIMIIDCKGIRDSEALSILVEEGILSEDSYTSLGDNVYHIASKDEKDSLNISRANKRVHVYFCNYQEQHVGHWGKCIAEHGFICGLEDTDAWLKVTSMRMKDSQVITNLTRSYSMDCSHDWVDEIVEADDVELTEEELAMQRMGLPIKFGQTKDMRLINDEAFVQESVMMEKDYDQELANLASSTECMSLSRISEVSKGESSDKQSRVSSREASPVDSRISGVEEVPNTVVVEIPAEKSMTVNEFSEFWLANGNHIAENLWMETMQFQDSFSNEKLNNELSTKDHLGVSQDEQATTDDKWCLLWENHCWSVYNEYYYKLVKDTQLSTMSGTEGNQIHLVDTGVSDTVENGEQEDGDKEDREGASSSQSNKRSLEASDFGVVSDEVIEIDKIFPKNHRLKKIKRESHFHKKNPKEESADALDGDYPKNSRLAKYWSQRYRLFRKFDEGIQLDEEAWYSVTPEKIAEHIAARMCKKSRRKQMIVMDAFCGVGGNTIQFALRCAHMLAVDNDMEKLKMAAHNAQVYGAKNRVDFILADMSYFEPRIPLDALFMSPPWGGPEYKDAPSFDLSSMPIDFEQIFRKCKEITPNIGVLLPRNTKANQLAQLGRVEIEQNLLNKKIKTITAYYGNLICD